MHCISLFWRQGVRILAGTIFILLSPGDDCICGHQASSLLSLFSPAAHQLHHPDTVLPHHVIVLSTS